MKVCLDAGHGGKDIGAKFKRYREKDITLAIVRELESVMKADGQHTPILTRMLDEDVLLVERLRIANAHGCDAFLSIHIHADPQHDPPERATGAEVWMDPSNQRNSTLCKLIDENLLNTFEGYPWQGIRSSEELDILQCATMPAALLEVGFIDSRHEAEFLSRPVIQHRLAQALCAALCAYASLLSSAYTPKCSPPQDAEPQRLRL